MSVENGLGDNFITRLAGTFKGGRISDWVISNRQALREGNTLQVELELLGELSPSFAKETEGLTQLHTLRM